MWKGQYSVFCALSFFLALPLRWVYIQGAVKPKMWEVYFEERDKAAESQTLINTDLH